MKSIQDFICELEEFDPEAVFTGVRINGKSYPHSLTFIHGKSELKKDGTEVFLNINTLGKDTSLSNK